MGAGIILPTATHTEKERTKMETREIKIWNINWNMEVTEYVRMIDGVDLHDAHVEIVKQDLYSYISDASKDAQGFRTRFDPTQKSVAELEADCEYWSKQVEISIEEDERAHVAAIAKFNKTVANLIECGAGDRETAIRWIRDGQDEYDRAYGDDYLKYSLGLPYTYDLEHDDREYYTRKAAEAA